MAGPRQRCGHDQVEDQLVQDDGWNVLYFRSAAGIPELSRAAMEICAAHGRPLGLPNSSWLK